MGLSDRLSITDVAKTIGVTPRTIMRWEKNGKIRRSKRDWRGWRFYQREDMEEIRKFYESAYEYEDVLRSAGNTAKAVICIAFTAANLLSYIIGATAYAGTSAEPQKGVTETESSAEINLSSLPAVSTPPAIVEEGVKYTLGPDDVVSIEVRRHPEFSGKYAINAEGKIEYKYIGDIFAKDLTKNQLKERLTKILSEYIISPEVDVKIEEYLSKVFYVVGEVGRPGKFYMRGDMITVREALVQSNLPTIGASMRKCRLITPNNTGSNNYVDVNVYKLLYEGDLTCNLSMKPGDVLYIPSTVMAKIVHVISPVTSATSQTATAVTQGSSAGAVIRP